MAQDRINAALSAMAVEKDTVVRAGPAALPQRIYAYTSERFPLTPYATGTTLFFFSAYLMAQASNDGGIRIGSYTVAGLLTVFLVFFQLRIMDEFKDEQHDARYHPRRPVPRGLVTLRELRFVGLAVVGAQVALNVWLGLPTFLTYLALLAFSLLMYREFFVSGWLRQRMMTYTLSHMFIIPSIAAYVYVLATSPLDGRQNAEFVWFLVLSFLVGLVLEIGRKVRAPEDETEAADTYSSRLGATRVADLSSVLVVAGAACSTVMGLALGFPIYYHAGIWIVTLPAVMGFVRYRADPSSINAGRLERLYTPSYMAGIYALVIIAVFAGPATPAAVAG